MRLAGFEPTTPWFVAKYSIQLSYSREAGKYSSSGTVDRARQRCLEVALASRLEVGMTAVDGPVCILLGEQPLEFFLDLSVGGTEHGR